MEPDRRTDIISRDRIEELTLITERLVFVSETQSKIIEKHTEWIDSHSDKYHTLLNDLQATKQIVGQWSKEIEKLNTTMDKLVDIVARFRGGWYITTIFGSAAVVAISLTLTILKILGKI